jgi:hypothetical protein
MFNKEFTIESLNTLMSETDIEKSNFSVTGWCAKILNDEILTSDNTFVEILVDTNVMNRLFIKEMRKTKHIANILQNDGTYRIEYFTVHGNVIMYDMYQGYRRLQQIQQYKNIDGFNVMIFED